MKSKSLGELEKQVMDIVWETKSCSARDVLGKLNLKKKLAYTTIATILQRLHNKGFVKRIEDKRGYLYSPKLTRKFYTKSIAQSFLRKFIDSFGDSAIASFAQSVDKLPEKKREYFLQLLKTNDKS
ncbi:MAG: BlaI/MecI/CopY family transcriptional regulator [Candidatus Levybacteria bacterium]|nr:BlaI/MecI/CopY family transcriptional regulator [Candidatus Levybacteria bacterium]